MARHARPVARGRGSTYTGIKNLTLGANVDYGHEDDEGFLKSSVATRSDNDAIWWGYAGYIAYDWTDALRTVVRGEFFADPQGTAAGQKVDLWKGLVGRLEYRHDQADTKVFEVRAPGLVGTGKVQETVTAALYYSFF